MKIYIVVHDGLDRNGSRTSDYKILQVVLLILTSQQPFTSNSVHYKHTHTHDIHTVLVSTPSLKALVLGSVDPEPFLSLPVVVLEQDSPLYPYLLSLNDTDMTPL